MSWEILPFLKVSNRDPSKKARLFFLFCNFNQGLVCILLEEIWGIATLKWLILQLNLPGALILDG